MHFKLSRTFLAFSFGAVALSVFVANLYPAQAQTTPATISFNVTAAARPASQQNGSASRTVAGRVHVRGTAVRMESKIGQQNVVVLYLKPYMYRLLPSSKAGVRYKSNTPMPELSTLGENWPELFTQPQKLRAALTQRGARRVGVSELHGLKTELYEATRWNGEARTVRFWLRPSDSLPLRMESSSGGMKVSLNWSNYQRGHQLSPALFTIPRDYRIRDAEPPKSLF